MINLKIDVYLSRILCFKRYDLINSIGKVIVIEIEAEVPPIIKFLRKSRGEACFFEAITKIIVCSFEFSIIFNFKSRQLSFILLNE